MATSYSWTDCGGGTGAANSPRTYCTVYIDVTDNGNNTITLDAYAKGTIVSTGGTYIHYIQYIGIDCGGTKYKIGDQTSQNSGKGALLGSKSQGAGSAGKVYVGSKTIDKPIVGTTIKMYGQNYINASPYTYSYSKSWSLDSSFFQPLFSGYSWSNLGSCSQTTTYKTYSLSKYQVGYFYFTPTVSGTVTIYTTGASDSYGGIAKTNNGSSYLELADSDSRGSNIVTVSTSSNILARDDDSGGNSQFQCSADVTANTTYEIFVHNYYGNADSGTLYISFTPSVTEYTCTMNPNGGKYLDSSGNYATANVAYTFNSNHTYAPFCATSTTAGVTSPATDKGIVARYYPSKPIRTGYTFDSWTANPSTVTITSYAFGAGGMYSSKGKPGCSFTATANWTAKTYTVTYDVNGGNALSTTTKTVTYDSTYGTLATPTRTGYTFDGWYTAASGGTKITSSTKVSITAAQTLYAHWTANTYTVTFNANGGGTPNPASKSVTYDSTYGTLATISRTNYTFDGWYTAASGGTKITSSTKVSITTNQTLYAHWTLNTFTVTFNANGGNTPNPTSKSVTQGSTYGTLATCTRTGYTLKGWYTAASGGTKVTSSTTVNLTANQTLYAQWTANTYTVAYNANGGTGTMSNSSHTYDTSSKLTANSFTKFGYSFKGWAKTLERAQAGTVDYANQASVSTLTTSGTYNLYAVWEIYTKVYIYTNKKDGTSKWVPVEKYTYTGS